MAASSSLQRVSSYSTSSLQQAISRRLEDQAIPNSALLPVAEYLFGLGGKRLRPRVVAAVAGAVNSQADTRWR